MLRLLISFSSNFIDPDVIESTKDNTSIDFAENVQLSNDELGVGILILSVCFR